MSKKMNASHDDGRPDGRTDRLERVNRLPVKHFQTLVMMMCFCLLLLSQAHGFRIASFRRTCTWLTKILLVYVFAVCSVYHYRFIFRPRCLHAVHKCRLSLHMSHVVWSVCLSICVGHMGEWCKKRLNRSRWSLGADSCWSKEPCGGSDPSHAYGKWKFWSSHIPAHCNIHTHGECSFPVHAADKCIRC